MEYILTFLIGAAAGSGVIYLLLSHKAKYDGSTESAAEIAALRAKLDDANQCIAELPQGATPLATTHTTSSHPEDWSSSSSASEQSYALCQ